MKIKAKVRKIGHSYGILIPKALVDTETLTEGENIIAEIKKDH